MTEWIDVSVPLDNGMVHLPGDPPFHRELVMQMERFPSAGGYPFNGLTLRLSQGLISSY